MWLSTVNLKWEGKKGEGGVVEGEKGRGGGMWQKERESDLLMKQIDSLHPLLHQYCKVMVVEEEDED